MVINIIIEGLQLKCPYTPRGKEEELQGRLKRVSDAVLSMANNSRSAFMNLWHDAKDQGTTTTNNNQ